jgi:hypothetical protein
MKPRLLIALMVILSGCHVNREPMDAAHAKRVQRINREYSKGVAENDRRWDALKREALDRSEHLIPVEPGTWSRPLKRVQDHFIDHWKACQGSPEQPSADALKATCEELIRQRYWQAFGARYFMADLDWVAEQMRAATDTDLEVLATESHNRRLRAEIATALAEIEERKSDFRVRMQSARDEQIVHSRLKRNEQVRRAQRERAAAFREFGQVMQDVGKTFQDAPASRSVPASRTERCSSCIEQWCGSQCSGIGDSCAPCMRQWCDLQC